MKSAFSSIVTATLPQQIADRVQEAILAGNIALDDRLPSEEVLARKFGVSRTTIREALKRLAAQNLVHSRRGQSGGTFLKRPDPAQVGESLANSVRLLASAGEFSLDDIVEARFKLGSLCCELAAARCQPAQFAAMRAEIEVQRSQMLSDVDFCASDVRFHQALVGGTGNSILKFLLPALNSALQPVTNLLVYRFRERKIIADQHEQIMIALERGLAADAIAIYDEQCRYLHGKLAEAKEWRMSRQSKEP